MRIGVMAREIGNQTDAPGIIIKNLLDHLLRIDKTNEYVIFYKYRTEFDRYQCYPNVKSVLLEAHGKIFWDQWLVPQACRREKVDLLFHPKHTLPLSVNGKTLMHLRGTDYWLHPEHFERPDLIFQRIMLPVFCRRATHLIAESDYARRDFKEILGIPERKISRIYLAPGPNFTQVNDLQYLSRIKEKYDLPSEFCLTVTRIVQGKKYYSGKNFANILKGFLRSKASRKIKFVVVGKRTKDYIRKNSPAYDGLLERVVPLDFVPQEDLPGIYNLAKFFLFPSKYESFGIPITEAMACGCPVITSTTSACPEIAGEAALLVGPHDPQEIADAIDLLEDQPVIREDLCRKGLERARLFNWQRSARETLDLINRILSI